MLVFSTLIVILHIDTVLASTSTHNRNTHFTLMSSVCNLAIFPVPHYQFVHFNSSSMNSMGMEELYNKLYPCICIQQVYNNRNYNCGGGGDARVRTHEHPATLPTAAEVISRVYHLAPVPQSCIHSLHRVKW